VTHNETTPGGALLHQGAGAGCVLPIDTRGKASIARGPSFSNPARDGDSHYNVTDIIGRLGYRVPSGRSPSFGLVGPGSSPELPALVDVEASVELLAGWLSTGFCVSAGEPVVELAARFDGPLVALVAVVPCGRDVLTGLLADASSRGVPASTAVVTMLSLAAFALAMFAGNKVFDSVTRDVGGAVPEAVT
jgi:hypothetical protein